ncbi:MAG: hypothetical protein JWM47_2633, partial [Acidimicrobiales bacterium]|nr:hypothetical protein [Acidimicrobiales bacterium]
LLAGAALLFRPDAIVGVALGSAAVLAGLGWAYRRRWLAGAAVGVAPYLVLLAMAGPGRAIEGMLIEPVFELRGGRSLPQPPSWSHFDGALQKVASLREPSWSLPALESPNQAFIWFFLLPAVVAFVVGVGWWRVRAEAGAWRPRVLLAVGLLGLGLMPQALQRPDSTHLAWVSCVPLAFLPAAVAEALAHLRRPERLARVMAHVRLPHLLAGLLARVSPPVAVSRRLARLPVRAPRFDAGFWSVVLVALVPLFVIPHFTARTWVDLVGQTRSDDVFGYPLRHGDRTFYLGSETIAADGQRMLDEVGPQMQPGERLFVGTADLRKTPYSDAYLYFLLPRLIPATRYIEMDPGMANRADSGMAGEVAAADWLILTHIWDGWQEPNGSRDLGSDAPNRVVRRDFCSAGVYGPYEVFRRCPSR